MRKIRDYKKISESMLRRSKGRLFVVLGEINYICFEFVIPGYRRIYEKVYSCDGFGGICVCRVRR